METDEDFRLPVLPMEVTRLSPFLSRQDSQPMSLTSVSPTPEPVSPPTSTDGNSSGGEMDEEDLDIKSPLTIIPALASPTTLNPVSPWPFGSVSNRGRSNSVITAALDLSAEQPSPSALPHEILLATFRMISAQGDLKACIRVCKSWCQCGVELLWHKPNFIHPAALDHHLRIITTNQLTTFPYATFIKRINFSLLSNYITDDMLGALSTCVRMERLTMTNAVNVTDLGLQRLFMGCHEILALDLSECASITDLACEAIASNLRRLQGLNLTGCRLIGDKGIIAIARGCHSLRRMKLRSVDRITDLSVINLAWHCRILLEIDLSFCYAITNASLWAIWRNLSHLRELYLNGAMTTDAGYPVLQGTPEKPESWVAGNGVQELVVQGVEGKSAETNAILQAMMNGTPLPELYDVALSKVPNKHFQNIRVLDLTSQAELTDATVISLIAFMPKIRNLVLAKCSRLTDESVYEICKLGKALHYLHLGHVSSVTDRAVARLARSCSRLRYIDLACCQQLTDASVFELANLSRLKRIGLVRVTSLTDEAIFALVERKSLERLHLSYCENVSVHAIHFLLSSLTSLTHLSLTGVPSFRRPDLQAYCRTPPKEFNAHQQQAFCVYSGRGVADLRRYLNSTVREPGEVIGEHANRPLAPPRRILMPGAFPVGTQNRPQHRHARRAGQQPRNRRAIAQFGPPVAGDGTDLPALTAAQLIELRNRLAPHNDQTIGRPSQLANAPVPALQPIHRRLSPAPINTLFASASRSIESAPPELEGFMALAQQARHGQSRMGDIAEARLPQQLSDLAFADTSSSGSQWRTPEQIRQVQNVPLAPRQAFESHRPFPHDLQDYRQRRSREMSIDIEDTASEEDGIEVDEDSEGTVGRRLGRS